MKRDINEKQSTFSKLRNTELTTITQIQMIVLENTETISFSGMIKLFEIIISVKMAYNESHTVGIRLHMTIIRMKPSLSC